VCGGAGAGTKTPVVEDLGTEFNDDCVIGSAGSTVCPGAESTIGGKDEFGTGTAEVVGIDNDVGACPRQRHPAELVQRVMGPM
jgi:hypothetical protein